MDYLWLRAEYHIPTTYSCRIAVSNPNSARALPAPSPATIRLALIRVGFELFGVHKVCDELFSVICAAPIAVSPPKRVAISPQLIRLYKMTSNGSFHQSIAYREYAVAEGSMRIYLQVPSDLRSVFVTLFSGIGYWGKSDSLVHCMAVQEAEPEPGSVACPLEYLDPKLQIRRYYTTFVTVFRDAYVQWNEIVSGASRSLNRPFSLHLYVWPLVIHEHHSGGLLLVRRELE
jgi:hypothetical protein